MIESELPLSLYVHTPWCIKKCPYCDFNSHEYLEGGSRNQALPWAIQKEYLRCLKLDLDEEIRRLRMLRPELGEAAKPTLSSIFIGGGTPSLCAPAFYDELLSHISGAVQFEDHMEITLEANPGTVDADYFAGYRKSGVNRLSIGVQSFNPTSLAALGRIHNGEDAKRAFLVAREAGFHNINLDIMHGLPGQSVTEAVEDLQRAVELAPEHVSWYQLTIEKNTAFYSDPPLIPREDTLAQIEEQGYQILEENGYERYEVSAYAKDNKRCAHNLNYWSFGDYLAIGAGAHGKLSGKKQVVRRWKTRAPKDYLSSDKRLAGERAISLEERPLEFLMNAFRLSEGFSVTAFESRTGRSYQSIEASISALQEKGLAKKVGGQVVLTPLGFRFLDGVLAGF